MAGDIYRSRHLDYASLPRRSMARRVKALEMSDAELQKEARDLVIQPGARLEYDARENRMVWRAPA